MAQGGMPVGTLGRESEQVELRAGCGVDQVGDRFGAAADLVDLVAPVLGERRHRHQPRLQHAVPREDCGQPVVDLEQHRVTGTQSQIGQSSRDAVRPRVEFGVGESTVESNDGAAAGKALGRGMQLFPDRPVRPHAGLLVAADHGVG
jgi:hypothetical protein